MCPTRYEQSATPPASAGACAGTDVSRSLCAVRNPAGYGWDVGGHACVPLGLRRAHPCRLRRGRERESMCSVRYVRSAHPPATAGT